MEMDVFKPKFVGFLWWPKFLFGVTAGHLARVSNFHFIAPRPRSNEISAANCRILRHSNFTAPLHRLTFPAIALNFSYKSISRRNSSHKNSVSPYSGRDSATTLNPNKQTREPSETISVSNNSFSLNF